MASLTRSLGNTVVSIDLRIPWSLLIKLNARKDHLKIMELNKNALIKKKSKKGPILDNGRRRRFCKLVQGSFKKLLSEKRVSVRNKTDKYVG